MKLKDEFVNDILRNMGVDIDRKTPPHWIIEYYQSKNTFGGRYKDGYICSVCGKYSSSKKEICNGCNSIMFKVKGDVNNA